MDLAGVGGTWNPGEELGVVLDDGDINLNSLQDEDQTLSSDLLPAVVIGNPLTIHSGGEHTNVSLFAGDDIDFAQRGILTADGGSIQFTAADINNYAAQVLDDDLYYLIHFGSSNSTITSVTATYATGSLVTDSSPILKDGGNQLTNFASIKAAIDFTTGAQLAYEAANTVPTTGVVDAVAVSMILSAASVIPETTVAIPSDQSSTRAQIITAMNAVVADSSTEEILGGVQAIINTIDEAANVADPVPTVDSISDAITTEINAIGELTVSIGGATGDAVVVDIFRFGQQAENIEAAATTRHSDAIYRMLLEESGDNTAMFKGSIEYVLLNQLNVGELNTYTSLATIDDTIDILITTDST